MRLEYLVERPSPVAEFAATANYIRSQVDQASLGAMQIALTASHDGQPDGASLHCVHLVRLALPGLAAIDPGCVKTTALGNTALKTGEKCSFRTP